MFFSCVARSSFSAHDEFSLYVDENYANFIVFSWHKLQLNTCDGNGERKKRLVGRTADDKSDGTIQTMVLEAENFNIFFRNNLI